MSRFLIWVVLKTAQRSRCCADHYTSSFEIQHLSDACALFYNDSTQNRRSLVNDSKAHFRRDPRGDLHVHVANPMAEVYDVS